jgi:hypothetical protein
LFAVLGKKGDGDPGHDSILSVHCHATNFQRRGKVTFVIEGGATTKRQVAGEEFVVSKSPAGLLVRLIVRQRSTA